MNTLNDDVFTYLIQSLSSKDRSIITSVNTNWHKASIKVSKSLSKFPELYDGSYTYDDINDKMKKVYSSGDYHLVVRLKYSGKLFSQACSSGNYDVINLLISLHRDDDFEGMLGACKNGDMNLFTMLINNKSHSHDNDAGNKYGIIMKKCAKYNRLAMLQIADKYMISFVYITWICVSFIEACRFYADIIFIKYLYNELSVSICDEYEFHDCIDCGFINLCSRGDIELVEYILSLNWHTISYDRAIYAACKHNQLSVVEKLINYAHTHPRDNLSFNRDYIITKDSKIINLLDRHKL